MQFVLLGAAIINLVFVGEWATTIVLIRLTVFNAVLGMRGEAKAEASLAAVFAAIHALQVLKILPYMIGPFTVHAFSFWSFLMWWALMVWI